MKILKNLIILIALLLIFYIMKKVDRLKKVIAKINESIEKSIKKVIRKMTQHIRSSKSNK